MAGGGVGVNLAVAGLFAFAAGGDPAQGLFALHHHGHQARGGHLVELVGLDQAFGQVDVTGADGGYPHAAIDQVLGGVGADAPELEAAGHGLAAPAYVDEAGLADHRAAVGAGAFDGQHLGVRVVAAVGIDGVGVVAAGVDGGGFDQHLRAAGVHDGGAADFGQARPWAAGGAFVEVGVAVDDVAGREP